LTRFDRWSVFKGNGFVDRLEKRARTIA